MHLHFWPHNPDLTADRAPYNRPATFKKVETLSRGRFKSFSPLGGGAAHCTYRCRNNESDSNDGAIKTYRTYLQSQSDR